MNECTQIGEAKGNTIKKLGEGLVRMEGNKCNLQSIRARLENTLYRLRGAVPREADSCDRGDPEEAFFPLLKEQLDQTQELTIDISSMLDELETYI